MAKSSAPNIPFGDPRLDRKKLFILPRDGSGGRTFDCDDKLPSLPVPSLRDTINRYLDSVKPHLTKREYAWTTQVVRDFAAGEGRVLQEKLLQLSREKRNWLERWWLDVAYLRSRAPLVPYSNVAGVYPVPDGFVLGPDRGVKIGALFCYYVMQYHQLMREERLRPDQSNNGSRFSMDQYRRIFSTTRIPHRGQDELQCLWKTESEGYVASHVVVLCRGNLFVLTPFSSLGQPFEVNDWEAKLKAIWEWSSDNEERTLGPGVATLTLDDRDTWAQNREWLQSLSPSNALNLRRIESALFCVTLDEASPRTDTETLSKLFGADSNRWVDKSVNVIAYRNGRVGILCDHTPFDAMVTISLGYFCVLGIMETLVQQQKLGVSNTKPLIPRSLPDVTLLEFTLDSILINAIRAAGKKSQEACSDLLGQRRTFGHFGKAFLRRHKLHPDAFVQMALQLAYIRLHHKPAPTYESATTREFYNGRTETVRSCTSEAVEWAKAMDDSKYDNQQRRALMLNAVQKHMQLMNDAKRANGCDRHFLGLMLLALNEGDRQLPEVFTDPAWVKSGGNGNFVLSTSLSGYTPLGGGCAPMCKDGYGCFYNIQDSQITIYISAWRSSRETSINGFFRSLERSLLAMQRLIVATSSPL